MSAHQVAADLEGSLRAAAPALLRRWPLADWIERLCPPRGGSGYGRIADRVRDVSAGIEAAEGPGVLEEYHRLAQAVLIRDFPWRMPAVPIPPSVRAVFESEFERMLARIREGRPGFHRLECDSFLKDLATCALWLYPCGARVVEIASGVPRGILFRGGARQCARATRFFLRCGGFAPFFEVHTHLETLGEFHPEGWDRCCARIADMLERAPRVRGMFGSSWFYDPRMEEVSPRLAYMRRRVVENGGHAFRVGTFGSSLVDALARSEWRRRLFHEGKYLPTHYLLVWARDELLRWARARLAGA